MMDVCNDTITEEKWQFIGNINNYNCLEIPSIGIYTREMKMCVPPLVVVVVVLGVVLLLLGDDFVRDALKSFPAT